MFSKRLVEILNGNLLVKEQEDYLLECINYWKDWQSREDNIDISMLKNEHVRNCNRHFIDQLLDEGYQNVSGININVSPEEFIRRLLSSGVDTSRVKKYKR